MASVNLYAVLKGTRLLDQAFNAADAAGDKNGRVSATELKAVLGRTDDFQTQSAMSAVHKLTDIRYAGDPTLAELRKTLGYATAAAAKADANGSQNLNDGEQARLANTWKTVVSFSGKHAYHEVEDILPPPAGPAVLTNAQLADHISGGLWPNHGSAEDYVRDVSPTRIPTEIRAKIEKELDKSHRGVPGGYFSVDYFAIYRENSDQIVGYGIHRYGTSESNPDLHLYQVMGFNLNGTRVMTADDEYHA